MARTWRTLSVIFVFVARYFPGTAGQNEACTPENRNADLQGCLTSIRQVADNSSYFWFGDSYPSRCPPELAFTIDCFNPWPTTRTLSSLAFGIARPDIAVINRYIDIKYTSGPGSYTGCEHVFNGTDTKEFTIDPLSNNTYPPWQLRTLPEITWPFSPSDTFTLVVLDVGFNNLHALYVNIPGDNISKADAVVEYLGPGNFREIPNVYAFLLFKQSARIDPGSYSFQRSPPRFIIIFNATQFSRDQQADLVGLSWLLCSYDASAVQVQASLNLLQNCASLVAKALKSPDHPKRPWLPEDPTLSVFLRVRLTSDATNYTCGNETGHQEAVDFYVDPIGSPIVKTAATRTESTLTYRMQMNRLLPNNTVDFMGKMYSLVFVDPDVPSSMYGTNELPLLHGLTININGSDVTTGTVLQPYLGPQPPDGRHYYYFLLYEQEGVLQVKTSSEYTDGCLGRVAGRCRFDVEGFVSSNNLTLVGVSWYTAMTDEYTECLYRPTPKPPMTGGTTPTHDKHMVMYTLSLIFVLVAYTRW